MQDRPLLYSTRQETFSLPLSRNPVLMRILDNHREWLRSMVFCRKGTFWASLSIRIVYSFSFREHVFVCIFPTIYFSNPDIFTL